MERLIDIKREKREERLTDRIFAQINYARRLSKSNGGKYDPIVKEAVDFIKSACGENDPINSDTVKKAEEILSPLHEEAKSYKVICAAHAHIDMNWQWGWDETVGVVVDTVYTMLKLLEEYPEFKFSLSQASSYKIIHDYAPELFEKVKKYVHEGRWEVTAPSWVECDKNMPGSESLARQVICAKKYLSEIFEMDMDDINVDFQPDTFGHSVNVPEILANAGVKYYYHCRGTNEPYILYRWQAGSGNEILVNRENNFYCSPVNSSMWKAAIDIAEKQGFKTTLRVYGVGDHGGGPSRRDIEKLLEMNSWPCFPAFVLGTYKEYFEEAEKHREIIPVVKGEIGFICDGCYSSQSKIKSGNKLCETELYRADAMTAEARLLGFETAGVREETRQRFLTNHFHDIVTGSGVEATRDFALGEYQSVLADCRNSAKLSARKICDNISTAEYFPEKPKADISFGAGVGSSQAEVGMGLRRVYTVFNNQTFDRSDVTELMLWDWLGDTSRLVVTDTQGNKLPVQVMSQGFNHYWGHNYISVLVKVSVPAGGYTSVIVDEGEYDGLEPSFWPEKRQQWEEKFILENEYLKITFDSLTGTIASVWDKEKNRELVNGKAGIFRLVTEAGQKEISYWKSEMSAWLTGRYMDVEDIHRNCELASYHGDVRDGVTCKINFRNSSLKFDAHLDKGSRLLKYDVDVKWLEVGSHEKGVPQLAFVMPAEDNKYTFDVPFGIMEREGQGIDLPGSTFASCGDIAVLSKDVYGYRCNNNAISLTMLRGSFDPDPFPEYGNHKMSLAVAFGCSDNVLESSKFMNGFTVMSNSIHGGSLKADYEGLKVIGSYVTSVDKCENGIFIRCYNTEPGKVEINCPEKFSSAQLTDFFGNKKGDVKVEGSSISFSASAGIHTVEIKL